MARKRATLTDLLNELTFRTIFDKYRLVALNIFEWTGLPDGITEKHLEGLLFNYGKAVFVRDPNMGHLCLQCEAGTGVNVYNEPVKWRAIGHGYSREYLVDDCVVIDNNKGRIPTRDFVMFYANKLTEAERTMDVNVKANKTPYIIACDDKDVLTFKAIFGQIDGNVPAVYADKGLNLDALNVFQTGVKFLGNELTDYKHSVESDVLTFLGVDNVGVDKRERLITDEAQSNNQLIESFRELQLESRRRACGEINALFGLNVSVRVRSAQPVEKPVEKEGDEHVEK